MNLHGLDGYTGIGRRWNTSVLQPEAWAERRCPEGSGKELFPATAPALEYYITPSASRLGRTVLAATREVCGPGKSCAVEGMV